MQYNGKLYAGDGKTFVELEKTSKDFDNMEEALKIHQKYNNVGNDLKAYLYELAGWALGNGKEKPTPEDYGI